jgi:alginate O-acetyltransferase complex protein AlgI
LVDFFLGGSRATGIKNGILLIGSLIFYAWGEPVYVLLMAASVLVNFLLALPGGNKALPDKKRRLLVFLAVFFNIGLLGVFKYADMVIGSANSVFGLSLPLPHIPPPIGISFFTFQVMFEVRCF